MFLMFIERPLISIILVTHHRKGVLARCLQSLKEAIKMESGFYYEFVIGVNGPDPESKNLLLKFKKEVTHIPFVIREFDSPKTPASARNILLHEAQGEWIYFIDDDAFVDVMFFNHFARRLQQVPRFCVLGGPNLTPPHATGFQNNTGLVLSSRLATFFSKDRYRVSGTFRPCGEDSLILCNLFVKKEILPENPFEEKLICAEENYFLHQMLLKEHSLYYDPDLFVWHERRPNVNHLSFQVFKYGRGRGQSAVKDIKILKPAHLLPSLCALYTVVILVMIFFHKRMDIALFVPFIIYSLLCLTAAYRTQRNNQVPVTLGRTLQLASLFPVVHTSYGGGLLWGAVIDR